MNERESQEITRMVESGWSCDFGIQGRTLWCQMLYPFEAELATMAVVEMSKFPLPDNRFKPQISDLRSVILKLRADQRVAELPQYTDIGKRGVATPDWVYVYSWCRFKRDPKEDRWFQQQQEWVDPTESMLSTVEYETLREEWVAAGSPKVEIPISMARK